MRRHREHWRALVLAVVLLGHLAAIVLVVRADRQRRLLAVDAPDTALELLWRRHVARSPVEPAKARARAGGGERLPRPAPRAVAPPAAAPAVPLLPRIDWARAAERAAEAASEALARQDRYRDLSAVWSELAPAERAWLERNRMEPVPRSIEWQPPRVEVTPDGIPLIHVNEHCVVVPMLAFLMFCKVGHIEANGHLLDHMRDPRPP